MAGFANILLIGIGLSMDAFAVSVCKGLSLRRVEWARAIITAFAFGLFQGLMPLLGWLVGESVQWLIEPIDHWVAFALLAAIGAKMIWDAVNGEDEEEADSLSLTSKAFWIELLMLAIATSIDAFVAGISFSMAQIPILEAVCIIGITTFVLSLAGFVVGNRFGSRFEKPAAILGGAVLILLGIKVLLEHMSVL